MTSIAHQPEITGPSGPLGPVRVDPASMPAAVARLLGVRVGDPAAIDFIEQSKSEGTDLSLMWMTRLSSGRPAHACLAMPSSGRTAMFFVSSDDVVGVRAANELSRLCGQGAVRERGELIEFACRELSALNRAGETSFALAQSLLEPGQKELAESFVAGKFERLAELAYMRRDVPRRAIFEAPVWPTGVSVCSIADLPPTKGEAMLRAALRQSYEATQDCPALCDLRGIDDVVHSHRSVGEYDARLWFVLTLHGEAQGCMLLSPCAGQDTVELVYVGLGVAARGMGLAGMLMRMGLNRLAGRAERYLACAVDESNAPAMKLYTGLRFKSFAKRVAFVRGL